MTKRFTFNTTQTTDRPKRRAPQPTSSDFEMVPQEKRPFMMYESASVARELNIYISDEFAEPLLYCEMIHVIRTASSNDVIYIHLNTPGGRLDTGVQLINAIRSTEATVITVLDGVAHSMGALLFLCGHQMILHDHAQLMFHTYSGGVMGKGSDMRGQTDATEQWFREIANDICYPFMSKREIQRMLKGEDFWFQAEQINVRLEKMFEIMQAEAAKRAAAMEGDDISAMIAALEERGYAVEQVLAAEDDTPKEYEVPEELTFKEAFNEEVDEPEIKVTPAPKPKKPKVTKPKVDVPEVKEPGFVEVQIGNETAKIYDDESIQ